MFKTLEDYNIHDRYQLRLNVKLTLTQPLSHISGSDGNRSNLMRMDLLGLDGNMRPCPMFTANAFRGWVLRRVSQIAMLSQLGIQLSPETHSLLFAGGSTQKGATMGNDLGLYDKIARLYPPLSLLGGAKPAGVFGIKHSQMLQGRLDIGNFFLVCAESAGTVPSWALPVEVAIARRQIEDSRQNLNKIRKPDGFRDILEYGTKKQIEDCIKAQQQHQELVATLMPSIRSRLRSGASWTTETQSVRSDAAKDPKIKNFLAHQSSPLIEGDKEDKKKEEKSTQMIMSDELLAVGSELVSTITTRTPGITPVEEGFLVYALQEWGKHPVMGGKASRGAGGFPKIEVWYNTSDSSGEYLYLNNGVEQLSQRATESRHRWQEYLEIFSQYLDAASVDDSVKKMLQ